MRDINSWEKALATNRRNYAQNFPVKGLAIKGWVICKDLEPLDLNFVASTVP